MLNGETNKQVESNQERNSNSNSNSNTNDNGIENGQQQLLIDSFFQHGAPPQTPVSQIRPINRHKSPFIVDNDGTNPSNHSNRCNRSHRSNRSNRSKRPERDSIDPNQNKHIGVAYIPNYETSVWLNTLFRNIKENANLDALEESDDEDEFESEEIDKFVCLDKKYKMICEYNRKFKMWIPRSLYDE